MNIERLQMSIQTVKDNITILESQEPEDAGYYLQLEHEKMVLNALEKRMPKRPIERKAGFKSFDHECPCCESRIISKIDGDWIAGKMQRFCDTCGQALDWNDHPTEKGGEG